MLAWGEGRGTTSPYPVYRPPPPSDFSWGEGGSEHRLLLLYPVMKCFILFQVFL